MAAPYRHRVNFFFTDYGKLKYYEIANTFVDWLNRCFDKTVNRLFYPGTVRQKVTTWPTSGSAYVLPSNGYTIDAYFIPPEQFTGGTSLHREDGGASVLVNCNESQLRHIKSEPVIKNVLLHEVGHSLGMAIGEYYSIKAITDFTMIPPELKVSLMLPHDHYWSIRPHWRQDVMLNGNADNPMWSPLSTIVAKYGLWRAAGPPTPDLSAVRCRSPFPWAQVQVIRMNRQTYGDILWTGQTDADGCFIFPWGAENHDVAVSNDQFRKCIFTTDQGKVPRGVSIFDVQAAWLLECDRRRVISVEPPQVEYWTPV